jgi:hypothetical protein
MDLVLVVTAAVVMAVDMIHAVLPLLDAIAVLFLLLLNTNLAPPHKSITKQCFYGLQEKSSPDRLISLIKKSSDNLKQLIVAQAILKSFFSREFFRVAWVPYFNGHNFNDQI